MAESYMASQMASTSMSSLQATSPIQKKEAKRTIVLVGCIVIILLAIVDSVLLYFWLMAPAQARVRTAAAFRDRTGYDGDDSQDQRYPILVSAEFISLRDVAIDSNGQLKLHIGR
ncbi:hypothetical protein MRX96_017588 [Rhipicephalus microplus]